MIPLLERSQWSIHTRVAWSREIMSSPSAGFLKLRLRIMTLLIRRRRKPPSRRPLAVYKHGNHRLRRGRRTGTRASTKKTSISLHIHTATAAKSTRNSNHAAIIKSRLKSAARSNSYAGTTTPTCSASSESHQLINARGPAGATARRR